MDYTHGLKAASVNEDVKTQADRYLAYTSTKPSLKILKTGDISVTTDGSGNGIESVEHGLGFAPSYFPFRKCTAQWTLLDASSYADSFVPDPGVANQWGGSYHHYLHMYTDRDNVYIQAKGAQPSTQYDFHYVLFLDPAESYDVSGISIPGNIGFKASRYGDDVKDTATHKLAWLSLCKSLQYYDVSYKETTLTLPLMYASPIDTSVEEGVYVDINHGLGYPPLFMPFFKSNLYGDTTETLSAPHAGLNSTTDAMNYGISAFCDDTRIRLSFWRKSDWGVSLEYWFQETVTLKCYVFTEDLTKTFSAV